MGPDKQPISKVRKIFAAALALPEKAGRDAYLDEACRADPVLRREMDSLIEAFDATNAFLSHDASGEELLDAPDLAGSDIDNYHLIECIGEGGFGEVYRAKQNGPLKREVALKIIKLGMDTKHVLARFNIERQALARMNHPNIAQVYDAGTTERGRPYFVMELLRGVPILEYCDRNNISVSDRIQLFRQVCAAVQHAHQKGILHRDLKPSNILVTEENGIPQPKVIDFGVAKSLANWITEKTMITLQEMLIGTPLYMSPEQLEPDSSGIDERSDIYSLGVILYELIVGVTPLEHRMPTSMTIADVRTVLHEKDLPRPSRRFLALGRKTAVIAGRRGIKPPALERLLRGDLDWIMMKAIEMEPVHRYDDVIALSEDLEYFLASKRVSAGPPSPGRRFRKFIRRHTLAVAVFCSIGLTILFGICIMTCSFFHLTKEPLSLIQERGWKLEKFYDMGDVGANGFAIRPDGSVLLVAEWGPMPKGLYWARKGGVWSEDDIFSIGSEYVDPEDAIELPDGIYVTVNSRYPHIGKVLKVPSGGGPPAVFLTDPKIINPYGIIVVPETFRSPTAKPGDLLIFDNAHGIKGKTAIWAVDRTTRTVRPLIMNNPLNKGFLGGGFTPNGTLYVGLNTHKSDEVSIMRISPNGNAKVIFNNFYGFEEEDRVAEHPKAVHPVTGEMFFGAHNNIYAFYPEQTSPALVLSKGATTLRWAPDGRKLYLIADRVIWTLSGPGIELYPVSTEKNKYGPPGRKP